MNSELLKQGQKIVKENETRAEKAKRLIEELNSDTCQCGKPKRKKHTFCNNDFNALPRQYQNALYRKIGDGYEENYEKAVKYLQERV